MGTNPLIQFAMQPVLIFGVVFHFVMGFVLEIKNRKARNVKYVRIQWWGQCQLDVEKYDDFRRSCILSFSCIALYRFLDS